MTVIFESLVLTGSCVVTSDFLDVVLTWDWELDEEVDVSCSVVCGIVLFTDVAAFKIGLVLFISMGLLFSSGSDSSWLYCEFDPDPDLLQVEQEGGCVDVELAGNLSILHKSVNFNF